MQAPVGFVLSAVPDYPYFFCSFAAVSNISCLFRAGAPRAADPEIIYYLCNEFNLLCIPILTFDAGDTVSRIHFIPDHRRLF
jgi:hypothetical protein